MGKKRAKLAFCLIIVFMLSGCSLSSSAQYPDQQKSGQSQSKKVMQGFDQNLKKGTKSKNDDDFSNEVRHLKYGQQKTGSSTTTRAASSVQSVQLSAGEDESVDSGKAVSLQLLSDDDINRIMNILVAQGYLAACTRNQAEFNQAIAKFQKAHNLSPTGELDSSTLVLLKQVRY